MKLLLVRKPVLVVCGLMIVYYIIMLLYYEYFICPNYAFYKFFLDVNERKLIETRIIFVLFLALSVLVARFSEFMYSIFIFFIVFFLVPGLITYSHSDEIPGPLYAIVVLLLALSVVSIVRIKIPALVSKPITPGALLLMIGLVLIPIVLRFGTYFDSRNLLLQEINRTRDTFAINNNAFINYFLPWLVRAVLPLSLIFFLIRKKYLHGLAILFVTLYLYSISGEKMTYITCFTVLFFFIAGDGYIAKVKYFSMALIVALLVLPVVDYLLDAGHVLKGTFVMRMFFFPSELNYLYFDFFEGSPLHFSSSSIFNWFFTYPFNEPVGFIISETYYHTSTMNANNGIISDGYMNLGYWGIGINILIVCAIFIFFNSIDLDPRYLGIFFCLVFVFLSAPMMSVFITCGLWIICVMAMSIMRREPIGRESP